LKNELRRELGAYLTKDIFWSIVPADWETIDHEIGNEMMIKPSIFYKAYLTHNPSQEAKLFFIAMLLKASPTFKILFYNKT
jgi:hypothetical protein